MFIVKFEDNYIPINIRKILEKVEEEGKVSQQQFQRAMVQFSKIIVAYLKWFQNRVSEHREVLLDIFK